MRELVISVVSTESAVYNAEMANIVQSDKPLSSGDELEVVHLAPLVLSKADKERIFKSHDCKVLVKYDE